MRAATAQASATLVAVPFAGQGIFNVEQFAEQLAIFGGIDILRDRCHDGDAQRFSGSARFSGVCPPNCTITPSGFSVSTMLSTFSSVSGSK
jgi:hypothetical protein